MHFVLCSPQVWWLGALCNPLAGFEIVCSPKYAHTVSRNPIILPFPLNNKLRSQKKISALKEIQRGQKRSQQACLMSQKNNNSEKEGALAVKTGSRSETSGGLIPFHCFPQDYLGHLVSLFCLGSFPTIFCFGFFLLFLNCSTVVASWALFAFSSASYRLQVCSGTRV